MDDFKREIWMQIRAEVKTLEKTFICNRMKNWLWANGVLKGSESENEEQAVVEEFFPEFVRLKDGILWSREEGRPAVGFDPPWFRTGWKEPRLALIDYILTSTT